MRSPSRRALMRMELHWCNTDCVGEPVPYPLDPSQRVNPARQSLQICFSSSTLTQQCSTMPLILHHIRQVEPLPPVSS